MAAMLKKQKILLLFAHPAQERSEVNIHLYNAAKKVEHVTTVDLYHEYPAHHIDVDKEQQRLREHDVIIFQFPLYWYSTPAILKDWQDLVLEYQFAYGKGGTALKGKIFLCALTAGGSESAYCSGGYNHYTLRELLRPLEQTANFCHMRFIAPFALFGARTAVEEDLLTQHIEDWKKLLNALSEQRLDLEQAAQLTRVNENLDALIQETV